MCVRVHLSSIIVEEIIAPVHWDCYTPHPQDQPANATHSLRVKEESSDEYQEEQAGPGLPVTLCVDGPEVL